MNASKYFPGEKSYHKNMLIYKQFAVFLKMIHMEEVHRSAIKD